MFSKFLVFKNHQGFRKYFFNTSWLFAEQFLRILSALFISVWVARYLGPNQYGIISYALAFTAIFAGIAKLGLDGIIVRELINYPEKHSAYLGTAFWLKILGAFLVIGIIAAILPFTGNDATTNLFILIVAIGLVFQSFEVIQFYFQSQVLNKLVSLCKVIQLALSSIIKIFLVLNENELIFFMLVTVFDAFSLAVSYFFAFKLRNAPPFYKHFELSIAKQLLKESWPLIFSAIVVMIYMRIDQIMIKELLSEYEVGIYTAAVKLSESYYFIPTLVVASLFPAILNAKKQSEELYKQRLQHLYTFMVWIAIAIAIPMTFLSDWLIILLYGEAYRESGQILIIHIWSSIFVFLGVASGNWFITEKLQRYSLINTSVGAILNVVLNFILIPKFGAVIAAYTTVICYGIAAYLMNAFWKVCRPNFLMLSKSFLPIKKL